MQKVVMSISEKLYGMLKKMTENELDEFALRKSSETEYPAKEYGCFCASIQETDTGEYLLTWNRLNQGHGTSYRRRVAQKEMDERAARANLYQ